METNLILDLQNVAFEVYSYIFMGTRMDFMHQDVIVTVESLMDQWEHTVLVSTRMVQMAQGTLLAKEMAGMKSQQLQLN